MALRSSRSSVDGKFVSPEDAERNPRETVTETDGGLSDRDLMEMNNVFGATIACIRLHGFRETIRRLTAE